ncbi:hypothetical protein ACQKRQ_40845 [Paraburkholderia sp. NPDC080076]|uniref:hypothetical protein n=1 Tax=Paraburkholderia sp. NPDC080076 TaxID=3390605 RepID=UPI003D01078F
MRDPHSAQQHVSRHTGDDLQRKVHVQLAILEVQQPCQREQRRGLHFAGKRRADAFVVVPPRPLPVQDVQNRAMSQRVTGERDVGVDGGVRREAAERTVLQALLQTRVEQGRISVQQAE